jgi:hypothetical protein
MDETHSEEGQLQPRPIPPPEPAPDLEAENKSWDNEGGHAPSARDGNGARHPGGRTPAAGDHSSRDAGIL